MRKQVNLLIILGTIATILMLILVALEVKETEAAKKAEKAAKKEVNKPTANVITDSDYKVVVEPPVYNGTEEIYEIVTVSDDTVSDDTVSDNTISDNDASDSRVEIADYFYYDNITDKYNIDELIKGYSLNEDVVSIDDLKHVRVKYYDFNGKEQYGEIICNGVIADDILEIFYELYKEKYEIERISLAEYENCDREALLNNNVTHCLNNTNMYGTFEKSRQAIGMGIYINPYYNPSITLENGVINVHPIESIPYSDRLANFEHKITQEDLAYKLFTEHGFRWGGLDDTSKELGYFYK